MKTPPPAQLYNLNYNSDEITATHFSNDSFNVQPSYANDEIEFNRIRKNIVENYFFNQIIAAINESVIITDLTGTILTMNSTAQSLTGYTDSETTSKNINMVFQPVPTDSKAENFLPYNEGKWECIFTNSEKKDCIIKGCTVRLMDESRNHIGYIYTFNTCNNEELPASERIIQSQRIESIGVLAGGMVHDFNNYLTGIINFVNLAKFCTINRQVELYLDNTLAIANDAQALTKQFLRYSKNYEPARKKIRIDSLLKESVSILFRGTNIKAELHVDENVSRCNIDEDKVSQLFGSIITNAKEAMPDGGIIDIYVSNEQIEQSEQLPLASGRYVRIQIKDNGCGMSPEIKKNLFKPHFTTKFRRSGLGLASAMIIAKSHQGYITALSEADAGSTFTIYFPAVVSPENDTRTIGNTHSSGKILVMDDEYYIRQTSSELLKKKNFEVSTATHGNEAIELFKHAFENGTPFDLVILDLTVPEGLGGIETLKKLLEINPHVKTIASSGYSDDPSKNKDMVELKGF
ncbi:MAG TPA: ATP-binding protein [Chitinispirillaceae bacterium]|nr:ATP-binding protein [Chitinispirillaceae bacterium]